MSGVRKQVYCQAAILLVASLAVITLSWADPAPKSVRLSNLAEEPLSEVTGPIDVPAWGLVTLRAELPD